MGKWEIQNIVNEVVNSKTGTLLVYWNFHSKNVDDTCYLLEWIAWDSFEFEKTSCVSRYSFFDPCVFCARSYYGSFGVISVILLTII